MIKLTKAKRITTEDKVSIVPIVTVKLWKDNPRKNDAAVPRLAEIIKARGQITPIVVWKKNMVAYKGNTTLKACRALGMKDIKVLFADFPSETSAIAYGIADNKSSEFATWDNDLLKQFMQIEEISMNQPGQLGFSLNTFEEVLRGGAPEDFKGVNAEDSTNHTCPKCGYQWN